MGKKDKNIVQLPQEQTSEVLETPDLAAYRDSDSDLSLLDVQLQKQLSDAGTDLTDSYAYSGIPSAVARQRMMDHGRERLATAKTFGMVEGFNANEMRRQQRLANLAGLTARRRQSGYTSTYKPNSGFWNSLIGAGATVGAAAMPFLSDERLKENIQPAQPVLPRLQNFQAADYQWKETGEPDTGVIAQDMAESFPEAVVPGDEAGAQPWMVKPETEAALALQGLKELNEKVDRLAVIAGLTAQRGQAGAYGNYA
jgi:hypothetical protein